MENVIFNKKVIHKNKKAYHDYEILERFEAGIVLKGTEIKSLRLGNCNLKDSYVKIAKSMELILYGLHISTYKNSGYVSHDPDRPKKLLMHKEEIRKLFKKAVLAGNALIPLSIYMKNSHAKVELALARGKKTYDKRESLKQKEHERMIERGIKKWK